MKKVVGWVVDTVVPPSRLMSLARPIRKESKSLLMSTISTELNLAESLPSVFTPGVRWGEMGDRKMGICCGAHQVGLGMSVGMWGWDGSGV